MKVSEEEKAFINGNTIKIMLPGDNFVIIREQNGADDDILSNLADNSNGLNFAKFLSAIVVETSLFGGSKLTVDKALKLPANIKYIIMIRSRIHSLGHNLEFSHIWPSGEKIDYTQDLYELVFDNYSEVPTEDELILKPHAVPYYPIYTEGPISVTLTSGKLVEYNLMTLAGENVITGCPMEKRSKNIELIARNLSLITNGKKERVTSFHLFSPKDMFEIRKHIIDHDPYSVGLMPIENPNTNETIEVNLFSIPDFFYLGGI